MPVRFRCHGCQRVLSALDRKIGAEVNCPGCGTLLVVPERDTVPAPPAVSSSPSLAPLLPPPQAPPSAAKPSAREGGIRISRRVLYAQAVLISVAALGFFVAGYFVGAEDKNQTSDADEVAATIHVAGRITIVESGRTPRPDAGAAVLVLPAQRKPRRDAKLNAAPLHPLEPLPAAADPLLSTVEALGGAYARTDDTGRFRVALPEPGCYHVVVISRETQDSPGEIDRIDLATLGEYVTDALSLLDRQSYVLATEQLADGDTFDHAFQR